MARGLLVQLRSPNKPRWVLISLGGGKLPPQSYKMVHNTFNLQLMTTLNPRWWHHMGPPGVVQDWLAEGSTLRFVRWRCDVAVSPALPLEAFDQRAMSFRDSSMDPEEPPIYGIPTTNAPQKYVLPPANITTTWRSEEYTTTLQYFASSDVDRLAPLSSLMVGQHVDVVVTKVIEPRHCIYPFDIARFEQFNATIFTQFDCTLSNWDTTFESTLFYYTGPTICASDVPQHVELTCNFVVGDVPVGDMAQLQVQWAAFGVVTTTSVLHAILSPTPTQAMANSLSLPIRAAAQSEWSCWSDQREMWVECDATHAAELLATPCAEFNCLCIRPRVPRCAIRGDTSQHIVQQDAVCAAENPKPELTPIVIDHTRLCAACAKNVTTQYNWGLTCDIAPTIDLTYTTLGGLIAQLDYQSQIIFNLS